MRFLVDEQLPPAIAHWLVGRGQAAEHVYDIALMGMADAEIARHCVRIGAVMVTKDEDYLIFRSKEASCRFSGFDWETSPTGPCSPGSRRSGTA